MDNIAAAMKEIHEGAEIIELPIRAALGADGSGEDWLTDIAEGSNILVQSIYQATIYLEFTIIRKIGNLTLLRENRRQQGKDCSNWDWWHNMVFCKRYRLVEVL